jgi:hypothetical protein
VANGDDIRKKHSIRSIQDYSYGDSSGFTPDSLFIHRLVKPNAVQTYCKGRKYPKRKIDSILPQIQNCSVETTIPAGSIPLWMFYQLLPKPT